MIYTHVRLLHDNGIPASVLHTTPGFRPSWLGFDAPRAYLADPSFRISSKDVLVVPEVHAAEPEVLALSRRRIVFVQASSYIAPGLRKAKDYRQLGYLGGISIMPHVRKIVERHYGVKAPVIPPCIAPWFFEEGAKRTEARKREVVLCPKTACRDYPTIRHALLAHARTVGWKIVELENKTHRRVADVFKSAAIHVNVNCQESFNATVPEAMAAGCIPVCYEAFGGRDYLRHGNNAYVFPTHHAYPLLDHTMKLMSSWDKRARDTDRIRRGGLATAQRYNEPATEKALVAYFRKLLGRALKSGEL